MLFFDDSHSDRYEVIFHCGFDLHFSEEKMSFDIELYELFLSFGY